MRSPRALFLLSRRRHSYITTPIFYANAAPHIGHLYTTVLSDAANRWHKLKDPNGVHVFVSGTDEHGIKIFRAAQKAKKDPLKFCDESSQSFRRLFDEFGIHTSDFIRTTEDRHKRCVEYVWKRLHDSGFIYKDIYSGWYSVVDECFFSSNDVEDSPVGKVVKGTTNPVEWVEEHNYMFRLSHFKERVRRWLQDSNAIHPDHYLPEALSYLDYDSDLSISRSRSRLPWGIPCPGDDSQIIYVWMDALMNYLSVVGFPDTPKVWPPTCQLLGKDILKFHAYYWPAFLMAMELPLPKKLFVHGHWLIDRVKMSKSLGNVVDPFEAREMYTADGLRYFLLKQGLPQGDSRKFLHFSLRGIRLFEDIISDFNEEKAIDVVNSDLVNNFGNLLSRATVGKLNQSQLYPNLVESHIEASIGETAVHLMKDLKDIAGITRELYDEMLFYKAIQEVMRVLKAGNLFFQVTEPWKLKQGPQLNSVLYIAYETVRISSILLQPIIPTLADTALTRLGISPKDRQIEKAIFSGKSGGHRLGENCGPLLSRIDKNT